MNFSWIFKYLTPNDDDPKSVARWRDRVAGCLTVHSGALVLMGLILGIVLVNWDLENFGVRFITQASADETHDDLKSELRAIQDSVATIKADLSTLADNDQDRAERERAREVREVRQAIIDLHLRACQAQGGLRATLLQQVSDLRTDYRELTGEEFPPASCQELTGSP